MCHLYTLCTISITKITVGTNWEQVKNVGIKIGSPKLYKSKCVWKCTVQTLYQSNTIFKSKKLWPFLGHKVSTS